VARVTERAEGPVARASAYFYDDLVNFAVLRPPV
jgi:hypothetical protein